MKVIRVAVKVGEFVAAAGVGTVVANVIKGTMPEHIGKVDTILIAVGTGILSWVASEKIIDYIEEQYTDISELIKEVQETIKESLKGIKPEEEA